MDSCVAGQAGVISPRTAVIPEVPNPVCYILTRKFHVIFDEFGERVQSTNEGLVAELKRLQVLFESEPPKTRKRADGDISKKVQGV